MDNQSYRASTTVWSVIAPTTAGAVPSTENIDDMTLGDHMPDDDTAAKQEKSKDDQGRGPVTVGVPAEHTVPVAAMTVTLTT